MIPTTQLPLVVPEVAIATSHGFKTISLGILKETPVDLGEGVPARALTFAGHYDGEVVECALIMQDSWEVDEPDGMRPISSSMQMRHKPRSVCIELRNRSPITHRKHTISM